MKNEIIESYLKDVCSYIKNKDVHEEISNEIREHIYEIVDEYTNNGLRQDEAASKAIKRLGNAYECGIKLNKVHKVNPDIITIVLALALAVIGIITMYSTEKNSIASDTLSFNNIRGLLVGVAIAIVIYFFDYRKLKRYSYNLYWSLIIILTMTFLFSDHLFSIKNGMISDSQVSFHLVVTTLLLIALSGVINIKSVNNKIDLITIVVMGIIPLILFFLVRDITVGFIYLCGINAIFLTAKIDKSLKISLICVEALFMILALLILISESYRIERIYSLINPTSDPEGYGYTITRIRRLLSQATLYGNEINIEELRMGDVRSDFTLVYIIYNFGIVFGGFCISIIIGFVARIFNIISKVKDSYGRTLVLSIGSMFLMQIIINMLSNLGIVGVYISLPFICFGSTNSIISLSMVGLICSIYRRRGLSDRVIVNDNQY